MPIVIGCDNALDFDPMDKQLLVTIDGESFDDIVGGGMIRIPSYQSLPHVVKVIKYLAENPQAYWRMLNWKRDGPGNKFLALVDMAVVHSECRLCLWIATRQTEVAVNMTLMARPSQECQCMNDGGDLRHRFLIRERGRFEYESVLMSSEDVSSLKLFQEAITTHFQQVTASPKLYPHDAVT